ncbi:hypothetical protein ACYEXS_32905 [Paenibacillus sp. MAH-36]
MFYSVNAELPSVEQTLMLKNSVTTRNTAGSAIPAAAKLVLQR